MHLNETGKAAGQDHQHRRQVDDDPLSVLRGEDGSEPVKTCPQDAVPALRLNMTKSVRLETSIIIGKYYLSPHVQLDFLSHHRKIL